MKISIVIPIYNVEQYLRECVDSVLRQTYTNIEVILVDDGSPDGCPLICDEYGKKDNRIKVIHKPNGGLSDARNFGIESATGDYVVCLDSDDWWIGQDSLEKVVPIFDLDPDIVFFDRITYCKNGQVIYPKGMPLSSINGSELTCAVRTLVTSGKFIPSACNKFVKTSLLKEHGIKFEKGLICEDIEWTFQIMQYAQKLFGFNEPFYGYRRREGSITANIKPKTINDLLYVIEKWSTRIKDQNINEDLRYYLLGYLNYQFCVANGQVCRIKKKECQQFESRFKSLEWLLEYDINKKTHLVHNIAKFGGIRNTRGILRFYIWLKNKGFKIQ